MPSEASAVESAVMPADVSRELSDAVQRLSDGLLLMDREYRIVFANEQARRISRLRPEDLHGPTHWELFPATLGTEVERTYRRVMDERVEAEFQLFYAPFGIWIRIRAFPAGDGIALSYADITALKRVTAENESAAQRMLAVLEAITDGVVVVDRNWIITYVNRTTRELVGAVTGNVVGRGFFHAFPGVVYPESPYVKHYFAAMNEGVAASFAAAYGEPLHVEVEVTVQPTDEGILILYRDVTQQRRDERVIRASEADARAARVALEAEQAETDRKRRELQAVYDTAPVGLALFEPSEFRYLQVNERQAEIIGLPREQILGRRFQEVATTDVVPALFARVARGEFVRDQTFTTEFHNRPGQKRSFNVNYSPVFAEDGSVRAISAAVLEITQLRLAEAALVQSEKLAAVGRLASSISHEINNPLEAVTNLLYLAITSGEVSEAVQGYLRLAQDELGRVSQIATQTLRFHRQADNPTAVTAAQLIDPVLNLYAGRLVNSGIHVEAGYSTAQKVLCFENDIRQVLNNLIANAIDAMRTGGRLLLRAHDACDLRTGTPGVRLAVADTGHGMSAETVRRIFEPFYTTKGMNGNGLGLWISKGIVERHRGQLRVRSSQHPVTHGTVFTVFLPGAE